MDMTNYFVIAIRDRKAVDYLDRTLLNTDVEQISWLWWPGTHTNYSQLMVF